MKRLLFTSLITIMMALQIPLSAFAQISNEEIDQYLSPIGWTTEKLENYLQDYFDMSIHEFETFEDLKNWIGTPITAENRQALLNQFNMTLEDLEVLLTEYGESPADYYFVEDLESAIHFYMNFDNELGEVTNFFALLGITDEELEKLFLHLSKLDEETVEAHMSALEERIIAIGEFSDVKALTQEQKEEMVSLFTDMLAAFKMTAKFHLESNGQREPVSLSDLLDMETLNGNILIIEFYDEEGNLLLDMSIDEDLFDSAFIEEAGELLTILPQLAHEHPLGAKMPETASPYVENMLIGLFLSMLALVLFARFRHKGLKNA
ncbi:processed acidic surface protein [Halalkalibacter alkalisediminis]|uniref:Processed acidic surface protein n=1 Tax=Halalkalibacter alkalisediminis TaxID=935616 RepID=A0ABV6NA28_9BACI|nr:processed acidic surface protein [Halalkalibacter alkalisediminis]